MTKQTCSSWCSSGTMWFWCTLSGVIPMYLTAHWFQWSYSWFTSRMENGLFAFKIWSGTACFSSYIIFTTPVCRFPSSSGQRSFWLTVLLQQREGFKGITNPPTPQKHQELSLGDLLLQGSRSPTTHPTASVSTETEISHRETNMDLVTSDKFHLTQTLASWVKTSFCSPHNQEHLLRTFWKD